MTEIERALEAASSFRTTNRSSISARVSCAAQKCSFVGASRTARLSSGFIHPADGIERPHRRSDAQPDAQGMHRSRPRARAPSGSEISFNFAGKLFSEPSIVKDVRDIFASSPIKFSQVVLEVTERDPIENFTETVRPLPPCKVLAFALQSTM